MASTTSSDPPRFSEPERVLLRDVLGAGDRLNNLLTEPSPENPAEFQLLLEPDFQPRIPAAFPKELPPKIGELFEAVRGKIRDHLEKGEDVDEMVRKRVNRQIARDYAEMRNGELKLAWRCLPRTRLLENAVMAYLGHLTLQNRVA
ncbi:hypothetical protein DL767_010190 [Monosporascus sp. MG133]|nr:hypothetical protein DL767_010190 [Monosporascus sp. MG133]